MGLQRGVVEPEGRASGFPRTGPPAGRCGGRVCYVPLATSSAPAAGRVPPRGPADGRARPPKHLLRHRHGGPACPIWASRWAIMRISSDSGVSSAFSRSSSALAMTAVYPNWRPLRISVWGAGLLHLRGEAPRSTSVAARMRLFFFGDESHGCNAGGRRGRGRSPP